MIQTYIEYFYAGIIVSETSTKKVSSRELPKELPEGSFGFRFFDKTEEKIDGEELIGKPKNYSNCHYAKGEILSVEDVKKKHPDKRILISNMENNNIARILMTKFGEAIPLEEKDIVLNY